MSWLSVAVGAAICGLLLAFASTVTWLPSRIHAQKIQRWLAGLSLFLIVLAILLVVIA